MLPFALAEGPGPVLVHQAQNDKRQPQHYAGDRAERVAHRKHAADAPDGVPPYARLLAATERGRTLLRRAQDKSRIPIITKSAAARQLPRDTLAVFELGSGARDLYVLAYRAAAERRGGTDWRTGPALV